EDIRKLTYRLYLWLVGRFRLAQHGGGVHGLTIATGEKVGRQQEAGCTLFPRQITPSLPALVGSHNGHIDFFFATQMYRCQLVTMVMRHYYILLIIGFHLFSTDNGRYFNLLLFKPIQFFSQFVSFGRSRSK